MSKLTFEDRRGRILKVATTSYHSPDDAAQDYLAAIEGATLDEQKTLFRLILSTHANCKITRHQCPTKKSIPPEVWRDSASQLQTTTRNWSECAMRDNAPLDETADNIWDQLSLCGGGNDRIVALGLLLSSRLVPYAQIPKNLLVLKPRYLYDNASEVVKEQITLLMRIENVENLTPVEFAVALVRIIVQIGTHEEQVAFLLPFLERMQMKNLRGAVMERALRELGSAIYHDLLQQQCEENPHDDEEEPNQN